MNKNTSRQQYDLSNLENAKIGVLSDTHSFINPSVFAHLQKCDAILHAGDIGSISVIKQLQQISPHVIPVCGNNDNTMLWQQHEHAELESIPQIAEVVLPSGSITITHGDEYYADYNTWHQHLRNNFPKSKAVIYGHSHKLVCDQSAKPWVLNPGAAGQTRIHNHGVSCLIIHTASINWEVEEFRV